MTLRSSYTDIIQRYYQQGSFGHVLDLGPGWVWPGQAWLADPDAQVTGLGYAAEEAAGAAAAVVSRKAQRRATYRVGGLETFPLPERSVDVIVSFGGLRAWNKPGRVLEEAARVLKPGGLFALGDTRRDAGWWQRTLAGLLSPRALRKLYHDHARGVAPAHVQNELAQTSLPEPITEVIGADFWILRRLG